MLRATCFIFAFFLAREISGQGFTYFNYSVPEGLPSAESYQVFEDRNGFIWIGTDHGVVKFDGQEMQTFQMKDSLSDPVVFGFQEDEKGRIWFRTYSGRLSYYENGLIKPYPHNDKLLRIAANGLINFTYRPDSDDLWFSVRNRVGTISPSGEITVDTLNDEHHRDAVIYLQEAKKDILVIAGRTFDLKWIFINDKRYPISLSKNSYLNKVFCKVYWNNKLYISAYNDIFEYDGVTVKRVSSSPDPVISMAVSRDNTLWVGYLNGGVKRFTNNNFDDSWSPSFLQSRSVTSVHNDKDGGYWFSTLENGVYFVPNMSILYFILPEDSKIKTVHSSGRHILVGDKSGIVRFYDRETRQVTHQKKFDYSILAAFSDKKQNFWISGHANISVYDSAFRLLKDFPGKNATDFQLDENQNVMALASQRLFHFDEDLNLRSENIFFNEIYRSVEQHDSLLFLAGRIGLQIRNKRMTYQRNATGFENSKIADLISLNDSTMLVSTIGNGFALLNTRTWKSIQYDSEHKFFANNIYDVLVKDSTLWLGTEKGIASASISSLIAGNPDFNTLSKYSGLGDNTVNFLANGDHSIWAFSDQGYTIIPDTLSRYANKKPAFYVKAIESNDKPVEFGEILTLSPEQNNVKFSFGFISFNNNNIFLRYRINESAPWIYTHEREIELTSLAPQEYQFNLQFSSDNNNWSNALDPIRFVIDPPWYSNWYVIGSGIIAAFLLGYFYVRHQWAVYRQKNLYLKIINEHQQKLIQSEVVTVERERNRIAKELHDGIGTNLTAIKLRVNQLLEQHDAALADEIEDQFQSAISEIKNIIYGLTPPSLERYGLFTALSNYVNKLSKNLPIAINLKTFGYDVNKYELNIIIFRVIQELLANSAKHSFARNISVHVSSFDDIISIIYEDDGIGFKYDPVQNGLGLDNIDSRIRSINGTLKFDSGDFGISYNIEIPLTLNKEVT